MRGKTKQQTSAHDLKILTTWSTYKYPWVGLAFHVYVPEGRAYMNYGDVLAGNSFTHPRATCLIYFNQIPKSPAKVQRGESML